MKAGGSILNVNPASTSTCTVTGTKTRPSTTPFLGYKQSKNKLKSQTHVYLKLENTFKPQQFFKTNLDNLFKQGVSLVSRLFPSRVGFDISTFEISAKEKKFKIDEVLNKDKNKAIREKLKKFEDVGAIKKPTQKIIKESQKDFEIKSFVAIPELGILLRAVSGSESSVQVLVLRDGYDYWSVLLPNNNISIGRRFLSDREKEIIGNYTQEDFLNKRLDPGN